MSLTVPVPEIVSASNNPLLSIHPSWERVDLKDIADILNGYAFDSKHFNQLNGFPLIRIRDIGQIKTECRYLGPYKEEYLVNKGDLIIGMDGDFNLYRWQGEQALLNQRVCKIILKTKLYEEKFLEIVLQGYLDEINKMTSSQTVKHISSKDIYQIPLPLPPLAEQRRIVAAVEALLARVNASRERLDRVPGLLKAFRQAVLAAACSGRLTEGWREENKDNSRLIGSPVIQDFSIKKGENERNYIETDIEYPTLPTSWKWLPIGEFIKFIGSGITPRGGKNAYQKKDGVPFIRSQNVYPDGLCFDDIAFISKELHNTMSRTHTKPNDVLLNITGASIGRSTFIPPEIPIANVNQHVCIIRTDGSIFPKYLSIFLNSQIGQDQIYKLQGGQTREGLNYRQVKSIKVSIPPLPEQHEIVRRVESLFALADRIEQRVAAGKERADRLTQVILAKAFRGELVPTEAELARMEGREYEPAGVLLERIRKERELQGERKPKTRKIRSDRGRE